jgi:hypothetical protein
MGIYFFPPPLPTTSSVPSWHEQGKLYVTEAHIPLLLPVKMHFHLHFPELKIGACLKFEVLSFTF